MTRQRQIEAHLRSEILSGSRKPGSRLPNYDEFQKQYGVARATMLYAIRQLKEAGLIESRGRGGLFVPQRPPHLCRYAIVFPDSFADSNLFIKAFLAAIPPVEAETGYAIEVFDRVRNEDGNASYARLLAEHAKGRLGGVLFLTRPREYLDPLTCPILTDPALPRIALDGITYPGVTIYSHDALEMIRMGTRMLIERGVRRLGIIGWGWGDQHSDPRRLALETAPGLRCDEPWRLLCTGPHLFSLVRNLTHLLLAGDPAQRPDGLLVLDDHLADQVGLGVIDAGRRGAVQIVSSGNYPPPKDLPVPVTWLGWRPQDLLISALRDLASARAGAQLPALRSFPPQPFPDVSTSA